MLLLYTTNSLDNDVLKMVALLHQLDLVKEFTYCYISKLEVSSYLERENSIDYIKLSLDN